MKPLSFISLLFILISCNNKADFYLGTWELNKENGVSTLTLSESEKLNWDFRGTRIMENVNFEAVMISKQKYNIITRQGKNCMKITMQKLSDNQCIGCIYKCWIGENMIDEVFIARKDQNPYEPIQKPDEEVIIIPREYVGDFFIVYQYSDDNKSKEIMINNKGIGINQGEPNFKQLFNANRIFRFEDQENSITIANPNGYHNYLNTEIDSMLKDEEVIVIQQGFNQTGRSQWKNEHAENVKDNLNIEYFEVRRMRN